MKARSAAAGAIALLVAAAAAWWGAQRLEPLPAATRATALPPRVVGFHLHVERTGANAFTFARTELEAALRDPYQLGYLGRLAAAGDGSGVEVIAAPAGSLAQRLGLEAGDVITSINGEAVATPRDLARLYARDYHLAHVEGQVRRGGRTLDFSYQVRG